MKPTKEEMFAFMDAIVAISDNQKEAQRLYQAIRTLIEKVDEWQRNCEEITRLWHEENWTGQKWMDELAKIALDVRDFGKEEKRLLI